ncbi:Transcriptional regulator ure2 [Lecanora helva]
MSLQPIFLHGHPGPNPWKIALLCEELNVPYQSKIYTTPELKQATFLAINPNGMAPVIEDPNKGLVLAESGAIMDYITDQYDIEKRISFTDMKDHYHMRQWLQFQTTTHGPVLQRIFHWTFHDSNPSARAGYVKDFRRVLKVLDDELADKDWLVGNKCSAADLSFVPFHSRIGFIMKEDAPHMETEYQHVNSWYKRMMQREAVKKVLEDHYVVLQGLGFAGPRK